MLRRGDSVTKHKTHGEAKHTETSEFGAEKDYHRAEKREQVTHAQPSTPNTPKGYSKAFLKTQMHFWLFRKKKTLFKKPLLVSDVVLVQTTVLLV